MRQMDSDEELEDSRAPPQPVLLTDTKDRERPCGLEERHQESSEAYTAGQPRTQKAVCVYSESGSGNGKKAANSSHQDSRLDLSLLATASHPWGDFKQGKRAWIAVGKRQLSPQCGD